MEVDSRGGFQGVFDAELVGFFIALGTRSTDGRPFACVKHTKLDSSGVGVEAHDATEGIYFANHVSFGESTDGGVAGHGTDGV